MYVEYKNLVIRNANKSDSQSLAKWWNDGTVMAHAGFPKGLGITAEEIEQKIASDSDETQRRLIIQINENIVGEMCYTNCGDRIAEIGIKICEPKWQEQGYGRILLSMLIHQLFACGYRKIILDTDLSNTRAQHVYEMLGFRRVKVNIDSWTDQIGEKRSSVEYALYEKDFINFVQ